MKKGVVIIGGILVVCVCLIAGFVVLAFTIDQDDKDNKGPAQKDPYDGLPNTPPPPPRFFSKLHTLRVSWDKAMRSSFSVRSNCWALNHFFRVTAPNFLIEFAKDAEALRGQNVRMSNEEASRWWMQTVSKLLLKMGSELDNCPRNTEVTSEDNNGRVVRTTVGALLEGGNLWT